jgi:hypothetical protein
MGQYRATICNVASIYTLLSSTRLLFAIMPLCTFSVLVFDYYLFTLLFYSKRLIERRVYDMQPLNSVAVYHAGLNRNEKGDELSPRVLTLYNY